MDLALDPLTGDLLLEDGDVKLLDGLDAIAQHIRIRFNFFKGEWFLDTREGTPWIQEVLGQKADNERAAVVARKVITSTPGVLELQRLVVTFDDSTREMTIEFVARCEAGVLNSADYAPFIVRLT